MKCKAERMQMNFKYHERIKHNNQIKEVMAILLTPPNLLLHIVMMLQNGTDILITADNRIKIIN